MTSYIVFAGSGGGVAEFSYTAGYLDSLVDQGILEGPVKSGEVWKPEDIGLLFRGDEGAKHALQSMNLPERYVVFMAGVADEERVERIAQQACQRFNLEHRVYDS